MRSRIFRVVVGALVAVGLAVTPLAANSGGNDVGALVAIAEVSKVGDCANDGNAINQGGGGLGTVPLLLTYKEAIYHIQAPVGSVVSLSRGAADLMLCGFLTGPLDDTADMDQEVIGASCNAHKGYGGRGSMYFPDTDTEVYIRNLGWKLSAGFTIFATGDASVGSKTKKADGFVMALQAFDEGLFIGCLDKSLQELTDSKAGVKTWTVSGTYGVLAGQGGIGNKKYKD